jgi:hypothetical protein
MACLPTCSSCCLLLNPLAAAYCLLLLQENVPPIGVEVAQKAVTIIKEFNAQVRGKRRPIRALNWF